ncbi:MAG: hypothetical protein QXU87_05065 [Candidatus Caldarchaeum sp.]
MRRLRVGAAPVLLSVVFFFALLTLLSHSVSGQQIVADVWTDKGGRGVNNLDGGVYDVGEEVVLYYSVNEDMDRVKITHYFPDGNWHVDLDGPLARGNYNYKDHRGRVFDFNNGRLLGERRVVLEVWKGSNYTRDEVRYRFVGCPSPLNLRVGIEIDVTSSSVILTGWVSPLGISWNDFITLCYNSRLPGSNYYHVSYIRDILIDPSLQATRLTELGRGVDDQRRVVWTRFMTSLDSLRLSDPELGIIRLRDSLKSLGGFIDEVRVRSFRPVWKASPTPSGGGPGSTYVEWINNAASAPDYYEVYIYPVATIKVEVRGPPTSQRFNVTVDNKTVGSIGAGESREYRVRDLRHTVEISPKIINVSGGERHFCRLCVRDVEGDPVTGTVEVLFDFVKQYLVEVDVYPSDKMQLTVDGKQVTPPYNDWWDHGSHHTLAVANEVFRPQSDTVRTVLRFSGWSDGVMDVQRTLVVTAPIKLTANYKETKQFLVKIYFNYGEVSRSDWYDEGSLATISLRQNIVPITKGTRAVFTKWYANVHIPDETAQQFSITVKEPLVIEAVWKLQHLLKIDDQMNVFRDEWVDENELVVKEAPQEVPVMKGVKMVFKRWEGSVTSSERRIQFLMDSPKNLKLVWGKQFYLSVEGVDEPSPSGWYDEGSNVMVSAQRFKQQDGGRRYRFDGWYGDVSSSTPTITITMDGPKNVAARWVEQFYIDIFPSYEKASVHGGDWYDRGSKVTIRAEREVDSGIFGIKYVFEGWLIDDKPISRDVETVVFADSPKTVLAKYRPDYTILLTTIALPAAGGISGTSVYLLKARRRKVVVAPSPAVPADERLKELEQMLKDGKISSEAYEAVKRELEERDEKD